MAVFFLCFSVAQIPAIAADAIPATEILTKEAATAVHGAETAKIMFQAVAILAPVAVVLTRIMLHNTGFGHAILAVAILVISPEISAVAIPAINPEIPAVAIPVISPEIPAVAIPVISSEIPAVAILVINSEILAAGVSDYTKNGVSLADTLIFFIFAKNIFMNKVARVFRYFSDKRFSTIAGTLVYFFIMSIAPFILWLTLVFGNVDAENFLSHELFVSISPFLRYLKSSAESAAGSAGIIFLVTTLYSSTNFFYHLRRSGEIIYNSKKVKGGIKLRFASLLLIFATIALIAVFAALSLIGTWVTDEFLPYYIADTVNCIFITATAFGIALILNLFACPYKLKISEAVSGSLLTTALWIIFLIGFSIYMRFASPERLYGKIASIIIFLLWCYLMMAAFVVGMIYNGLFKVDRKYKELL